jgi:hypothetical protein
MSKGVENTKEITKNGDRSKNKSYKHILQQTRK